MNTTERLTETSPELVEALKGTLDSLFGEEPVVGPLHTGGGMMVMVVDLDRAGNGRQLWLTREDEGEWFLGFYDFADNEDDEGLVVGIHCPNDYSRVGPAGVDPVSLADSPWYVASQVAGILYRLGVTELRGA